MNPETRGEKLTFNKPEYTEQIDHIQSALQRWDSHKGSDSVTFQEMREGDFRSSAELLPELISELDRHNRCIELQVGKKSFAMYEIKMLHGVSPSEIVGLATREVGPHARVPLTYFNSLYPLSRLNGKGNTFIGSDRKSVLRLVDVAESLNNGGKLSLERRLTLEQRRAVIDTRELSISLTGWHNSKGSSYPGIENTRKAEAASARHLFEYLSEGAHKNDYRLVLKVGSEPIPTHHINRGEYDSRTIRAGKAKEPGEEIVMERTVESARKYEEKSSLFFGKYDLVQFDDLAKAIAEHGAELEVRFNEE